MTHYLDRVVGSDLSYQVLQRQRCDPEVTAAKADQSRQHQQSITGRRRDVLSERLTGEYQPLDGELAGPEGRRHG